MDPATLAALTGAFKSGSNNLYEGLGSMFGGMFGNSGDPYKKYAREYGLNNEEAIRRQDPFYGAGLGGMQNYQNWLGGMQNPTNFINQLMNNYQESPYARNLQNEAMRAGQNMGSASGLTGSTPLMQQMQQNAGNIASADQNQWLQNVLGVNNQYGQGQQNLMGAGQNAANAISQLFEQRGQNLGMAQYGQQAGKNQDFMSILGGLFKLLGGGNGQGGGGFNNPGSLARPT